MLCYAILFLLFLGGEGRACRLISRGSRLVSLVGEVSLMSLVSLVGWVALLMSLSLGYWVTFFLSVKLSCRCGSFVWFTLERVTLFGDFCLFWCLF